MKTLLALVMVIGFGVAAEANAACRNGETHYWPSNNPALQTGEGAAQDVLWTCVNGRFVEEYVAPAVKHRGCTEGESYYWPSNNPALRNGESGVGQDVLWTCKGGRFVENGYTAPKPKRNTCKEGEIAYGNEIGESGEYISVTLVCRNGKFKRAHR